MTDDSRPHRQEASPWCLQARIGHKMLIIYCEEKYSVRYAALQWLR